MIYGTADVRSPPSGSQLYGVGVTASTIHPFRGSLVFDPQFVQHLLQIQSWVIEFRFRRAHWLPLPPEYHLRQPRHPPIFCFHRPPPKPSTSKRRGQRGLPLVGRNGHTSPRVVLRIASRMTIIDFQQTPKVVERMPFTLSLDRDGRDASHSLADASGPLPFKL